MMGLKFHELTHIEHAAAGRSVGNFHHHIDHNTLIDIIYCIIILSWLVGIFLLLNYI